MPGCIPAGGVTGCIPAGGVTGCIPAGGVAGCIPAGVGLDDAVGAIAAGGFVTAGGTAVALPPAAPTFVLGVFTGVFDGVVAPSLPPQAERMAATPMHVAKRDLMSASNIETSSNQMRVVW
jgi:hypothetical protein